jgi:hypothetical protein
MKRRMYSIKDVKADSFSVPVSFKNDSEASRALCQHVLDKSLQMSLFPEDYTLFYVGIFDEDTGNFEDHDNNISILNASAAKAMMQEKENINEQK